MRIPSRKYFPGHGWYVQPEAGGRWYSEKDLLLAREERINRENGTAPKEA